MRDEPSIALDGWAPISPGEVAVVFGAADFPWCLAGGHALERLVGESFREHADIDVVVLRPDQLRLQRHLSDWELWAADPPGHLRRWASGEPLLDSIHDIWCARRGSRGWGLQVMLQDVDRDCWVYRRDPTVRGPVGDLVTVLDGVPCIRPEIQLLYKSHDVRAKDRVDFDHCLAKLDVTQRESLARWLALVHPSGHEWIPRLTE